MRTARERKQKSSEVEEKEITKCILNFKVTSPETIQAELAKSASGFQAHSHAS